MLHLEPKTFRADFSLHNHSNWSDGKNTLEEMCQAAKAAGLHVFGMSDHWVAAPRPGMNSEVWSMKLERLRQYVEELKAIRDKLEDDSFQLLIGVEADFFHENYGEVFDRLRNAGLDYIIGSVHYSDDFPIDHCADDWKGLSQGKIDEIWNVYWDKIIVSAEKADFDIVGHLDLPKKFAYAPSFDYTSLALKALDAIAKSGKAIELNTAGWDKPCKEQYPSSTILAAVIQRNIPVVISADAHDTADLTRHFNTAAEMLKNL